MHQGSLLVQGKESGVKLCGDKQCRRSGQALRLTEFPRNRIMKNGRHSYCKECSRRQVAESRARIRPAKEAQRRIERARRQAEIAAMPSPIQRVRFAIQNGARTQAQIGTATRLDKDEIGDALAILLLWNKEIRTRVIDDARMYFPVNRKAVRNVKGTFELISQGESKAA